MAMTAPPVSEVELSAFQAAHFSAASTTSFAVEFLGPVDEDEEYNEEGYEEAEDNGLGYYADGVKRTLTDEQIAIFRHSEIETLMRERRHAKEAQDDVEVEGEIATQVSTSTPLPEPVQQPISKPLPIPIAEPLRPIIGPVIEASLEDGELEDDTPEALNTTTANGGKLAQGKKNKKKKQQKGQQREREPKPKGFFRANVKPDLRKRTWDVVEKGMDGLDYDEVEGGAAAKPSMAKRRQISYDD